MMRKTLLSIFALSVFFVMAIAFGARAQENQFSSPNQFRVDRDFGSFTMHDSNRFGDDRAYSSTYGGSDRDADFRFYRWVPNTYGLQGDYGYDSNGAG